MKLSPPECALCGGPRSASSTYCCAVCLGRSHTGKHVEGVRCVICKGPLRRLASPLKIRCMNEQVTFNTGDGLIERGEPKELAGIRQA